ncbi:hypothetical protein LOK49_LG01G00266 [Camellia lanceoleosa]|uniref:Uncharacterized protein n=1 Tax=Camellia lanceoleosa TaxID=1840588 RepID=A0ACC0IZR3_9ERIC|nr:hypothetical protein LOK49_LG01G00266 [Camellia lanceoleosa]
MERKCLGMKKDERWKKRDSPWIPPMICTTGQGGNAARSLYEGQMPDPKVDSLKQPNMESGFQAHEQDMEIGYEDKPSTLTFEGLEQRFLDEIMKLAKEAQGG